MLTKEEIQTLAQHAAQELGIDGPVYNAKQVNANTIRIWHANGYINWTIPGQEPEPEENGQAGEKPIYLTVRETLKPHQLEMMANPSMYSREELRNLAEAIGLPVTEKDWKRDLVKLINQWKKDNWKEENQ